MTKIKAIFALFLLIFSGLLQAAFITKPFEALVQVANNGGVEGVAVGDVFSGELTYDDAIVTPQQDGTIIVDLQNPQEGSLVFNFNGITDPIFAVSATLSPIGALVDLNFSIDIGNRFFFSTDLDNPLKFNFEFSKLDDEGNQIITANGAGIFREPVVVQQTPIPAAFWLFVSGLGLIVRRRTVG